MEGTGKNMDKILSVSIAAYNVEKTLEDVLNPFCASKYKDLLDVMIINDGSKDKTEDIALRYVKKYPQLFRLINKENGGWGSTLNRGFKEAKGKYFKQLDGDDYFSLENLDDFILYLNTVDTDMVYSPFVTFEDKTNAIMRVIGAYNCFTRENTYYIDELSGFMPAMHDITIKTDVLRNNAISITEHCFYTDVEYVIKSYNSCETMSYYERPIYYYRLAREGQSMSTSGVIKHYAEHEKMLFTVLKYYKENVHIEAKNIAIKNRLIDVCNMQYSFYCILPTNSAHKKEFKNFDDKLKQYPEFYSKIPGSLIAYLRKNNFNGYYFISKIKNYREKKNKWNFFGA